MSSILKIDVVSMAAAAGFAACQRLASVMDDEGDANLWINGGHPMTGRDMEQDVQTLAAYVCSRRAVHGEQLFLKARELGLHRFAETPFIDLPDWLRTAYSLFGTSVLTCFTVLEQAQTDARQREERARQLAAFDAVRNTPPLLSEGDKNRIILIANSTEDDTAMEQVAGAMELQDSIGSTDPAAGLSSPGAPAAGAVAEGEGAAGDAAPPSATDEPAPRRKR